MKLASFFTSGIARKGAIIVAVPLLFELLFLQVLLAQLDQAERDRVEAAHLRAIRAQSDVILADFYDAAASLLPYAGNPNSFEGSHYTEIVKRLPGEVDKLVSMGKTGPEKEHLLTAQPTLMRGVHLLEDLQKTVTESRGDISGLVR
ncbi:MAG: hypothetical protein JSS86_20220, partial [Cyanobacteria bacterium SZAS LIN-2]|nr:hypothetical protein [Cyanobacteria bacterium SZAS LIN-2]